MYYLSCILEILILYYVDDYEDEDHDNDENRNVFRHKHISMEDKSKIVSSCLNTKIYIFSCHYLNQKLQMRWNKVNMSKLEMRL